MTPWSITRPKLRVDPCATGQANGDFILNSSVCFPFILSNRICFPLSAWKVLIFEIHSWPSKNLHGNIRTLFIVLKVGGEKCEEWCIKEKRGGSWMCCYSSWLVLALRLLFQECMRTTDFIITNNLHNTFLAGLCSAETADGVTQRHQICQPGIYLLDSKWKPPN